MNAFEEIILATARGLIRESGACIENETEEAIYVGVPRGSKMSDEFFRLKIKTFISSSGCPKKLMFRII